MRRSGDGAPLLIQEEEQVFDVVHVGPVGFLRESPLWSRRNILYWFRNVSRWMVIK
jgi:hypothetical protein